MMHESLRVLLSGLIDYAGLFPPAALDMHAAVKNYAAYLRAPHSWMLGRFVVPVARLPEFENAIADLLSESEETLSWRLSALCGANLEADIQQALDFNRRHSKVFIDAVELKASTVKDIEESARFTPQIASTFYEIEATNRTPDMLAAIARAGAGAKFRTGGLVAEMFPSVVELASFIGQCHQARVPFKATAGLHHPLRGVRPLTYEENGPSGTMHGFLNVFLAAGFIGQGMSVKAAAELLEEKSIEAFDFRAQGVEWRSFGLSNDKLRETRRSLALSFGSCSFIEPISDLQELNLL